MWVILQVAVFPCKLVVLHGAMTTTLRLFLIKNMIRSNHKTTSSSTEHCDYSCQCIVKIHCRHILCCNSKIILHIWIIMASTHSCSRWNKLIWLPHLGSWKSSLVQRRTTRRQKKQSWTQWMVNILYATLIWVGVAPTTNLAWGIVGSLETSPGFSVFLCLLVIST